MPHATHPDHDRLLQELQSGAFSFVDLGCGTGESISHCEKQFGLGKGIGFDVNPEKIKKAIENNYPAIFANVTKESFDGGLVRFCTMMDFLEHLPSEDLAKEILHRAGGIASDFLFIRHPSFEDIDYLAGLGLKLGWTDWSVHTNMMLMEDFHRVFESLGFADYCIIPRKQILSSAHPSIVPADAPSNAVTYDSQTHGPKKTVYFSRPVWTQFDIYVRLSDSLSVQDWSAVLRTSHVEDINRELLSCLEREVSKRRKFEANLIEETKKRRQLQEDLEIITEKQRELKKLSEQLAEERQGFEDETHDEHSDYREINHQLEIEKQRSHLLEQELNLRPLSRLSKGVRNVFRR